MVRLDGNIVARADDLAGSKTDGILLNNLFGEVLRGDGGGCEGPRAARDNGDVVCGLEETRKPTRERLAE